MTGEEYNDIRMQLGFTHDELADALGITGRTSNNYARSGPPRAVEIALRALLEMHLKRKPRTRKVKPDEADMSVLPDRS